MKTIKLKLPETLKECVNITCEDCYYKGIMQISLSNKEIFCPQQDMLFDIQLKFKF